MTLRKPDSTDSTYREADELAPIDEQRQEFRLTGRVWVDVEVEAADGGRPARHVRCSSSDLSANGLRVHIPEMLAEGAILPLTVLMDGQTFHLIGEIKWCFPGGGTEDGFVAGLAIHESDQTSILEWKDAIVRLLSD